MEVFLLWLDDLDDLVGSIRMLWPACLSFLGALTLFVLTIFGVMEWPWLLAIAGVLVMGALGARAVQDLVAARLNSDP